MAWTRLHIFRQEPGKLGSQFVVAAHEIGLATNCRMLKVKGLTNTRLLRVDVGAEFPLAVDVIVCLLSVKTIPLKARETDNLCTMHKDLPRSDAG